MQYVLSNRQLKELANGKSLQIALPVPTDDQPDLVSWARASLAISPQYVRRAEESEVWCAAHRESDHEIERQIGRILRDHEEPPSNHITYSVAVIIVELSARDQHRGKYPVQWPARFVQED